MRSLPKRLVERELKYSSIRKASSFSNFTSECRTSSTPSPVLRVLLFLSTFATSFSSSDFPDSKRSVSAGAGDSIFLPRTFDDEKALRCFDFEVKINLGNFCVEALKKIPLN